MFVSYPYNITMPDLGKLEDLYYATCAKLKELLQRVDILLTNGFKGIHENYFAYQDEPLKSLGSISIGAFKQSLLIQESILHSSELRSLLNRAVLEKKNHTVKHDRHHGTSSSDSTAQQVAQRGNGEGARKYMKIPDQEIEQISGRRTEAQGLLNKSNMSCGMVFGELAEKYRTTAMSAEVKGSQIGRKSTPEAPQAFQEKILIRNYISPYNLDERAKKLNVPGGPEMPCICDPECICAPLCASDPTQNCLCEENGLFVRVTEGMDIDDLDVPDLVRRERQSSQASESSAASFNSIDGPASEWSIHSATYADAVTPSNDRYHITDRAEKQIREQKIQSSDSVAVFNPTYDTSEPGEDVLSMSDIISLSEKNDSLPWQDRLSMRPLRMSDFTPYELTQPFSKLCDHPPRRQSVAKRLFKTKTSIMAAHKNTSTTDQATQGRNVNGGTSKVMKQPNKRSLADISFTGLRFTRRVGSHGCGT